MADMHAKHKTDDELLQSAIPIDMSDNDDEDLVEIEAIEVDPAADAGGGSVGGSTKIRQFTEHRSHEERWNRKPNATGQGAIHVKTFVAKLRLDAIDHLDEQVNEWLDNHPEYEVKFVTTTVGRLVGKTTEDALFMNVWV